MAGREGASASGMVAVLAIAGGLRSGVEGLKYDDATAELHAESQIRAVAQRNKKEEKGESNRDQERAAAQR